MSKKRLIDSDSTKPMRKSRVGGSRAAVAGIDAQDQGGPEEDIHFSAREKYGLERMEQVNCAVLEPMVASPSSPTRSYEC